MLLLTIVVCCGPLALPLHVVVRPNYSRSWPAVCLRMFCHNYCWFIILHVLLLIISLVLFVHEKSVNPLRSRRELIHTRYSFDSCLSAFSSVSHWLPYVIHLNNIRDRYNKINVYYVSNIAQLCNSHAPNNYYSSILCL